MPFLPKRLTTLSPGIYRPPGGAASFPQWTPADLLLAGEYDAEGANLSLTGTDVDEWTNLGSEGGTLVDAGTKPTWESAVAAANNQPAVRFLGVASSHLVGGNVHNISGDFEMLAVVIDDGNGVGRVASKRDGSAPNSGWECGPQNAGATAAIVDGGATSVSCTENFVTGTVEFWRMTWEAGSPGTLSMRVDGTVAAATTGTPGSLSNAINFAIGGRQGSVNWDGWLFLLWVRHSLFSSGEQASALSYLNTRFGVSKAGV